MENNNRLSKQIILATRNPAKLAMFSQAFAYYGFAATGLGQLGVTLNVEEHGHTPEANALLKAQAAWASGSLVFADDAGMEVDALGGEPGVQTRRWNGRFNDDVDDQTWLDYLLARLDGVPLPERTAKFVSGWALIGPTGQTETKRIVTPFLVAEKPRFPMAVGFPLSAVQIRLPEDEQDVDRLVRRELDNWQFFRELTVSLV